MRLLTNGYGESEQGGDNHQNGHRPVLPAFGVGCQEGVCLDVHTYVDDIVSMCVKVPEYADLYKRGIY